MKILTITAHYPPCHFGGYELRIKDIMDGLTAKGHIIQVLTTVAKKNPLVNSSTPSYPIIRKLHNRDTAKFFPKEILFDLLDTRTLEKQITEFKPDLIYLGHIYVLSKALLPYLARLNTPLVLDEGGASLKGAWTDHGRWFRFTGDYGEGNLLIRMLKPLVIKFICWLSKGRIRRTWRWPEHINLIINSQHNFDQLRNLGIPLNNATVLHSGIDLAKFPYNPTQSMELPIKIICPGRLETRKGMLDAVHLLRYLIDNGIDGHLTFSGETGSEEFKYKLVTEIKAANLQDKVTFYRMLSQEDLITLYHQSDICFFPSYQEMGFSRTPLEAMACGCLVISYGNEGSDEILQHGVNGFIVQPDEFQHIVNLIRNLISRPNKIRKVIKYAREEIEKGYSQNLYLEQIEAYLQGSISYV